MKLKWFEHLYYIFRMDEIFHPTVALSIVQLNDVMHSGYFENLVKPIELNLLNRFSKSELINYSHNLNVWYILKAF